MSQRPYRVRGSSSELVESARSLRREMTPAERAVWERIRSGRVNGLRFRRQHPLGQFILDFACTSLKIGIEVDGSIHIGNEEQDRAREEWLQQYGWTIVRFSNTDVLSHLESVIRTIAETAEARSISSTRTHQ